MLLRVRRRHARHPHHAQSTVRGNHARGVDRPGQHRAPAGLGGDVDQLRQFRLDAFARESRDVRSHVPLAARRQHHRPPHGASGLRRHGQHVSAGSLRQRHLPQLRHGGPIWGLLRELRRHVQPGGPQEPCFRGEQHATGVARFGTLFLSLERVRVPPRNLGEERRGSGQRRTETRRVVLTGLEGLGHFP